MATTSISNGAVYTTAKDNLVYVTANGSLSNYFDKSSLNENDIISLLIILPEKTLSDILLYMLKKVSGNQLNSCRLLITEIIKQRHFSEDFLMQFIDDVSDKNSFLAVHRYEIVNDVYKSLALYLMDCEEVKDIL